MAIFLKWLPGQIKPNPREMAIFCEKPNDLERKREATWQSPCCVVEIFLWSKMHHQLLRPLCGTPWCADPGQHRTEFCMNSLWLLPGWPWLAVRPQSLRLIPGQSPRKEAHQNTVSHSQICMFKGKKKERKKGSKYKPTLLLLSLKIITTKQEN